MYFVSVILFLLVLPVASVAVEWQRSGDTLNLLLLTGRWFCFWAVGVRLFVAGVRQVLQPAFTSREIFGLDDPGAFPMVREIGFGNLSMGVLGLWSLTRPAWLVPAAIVGGLCYGLAGAGHLPQKGKNCKEWTALISDLFVFAVLLVFVASSFA